MKLETMSGGSGTTSINLDLRILQYDIIYRQIKMVHGHGLVMWSWITVLDHSHKSQSLNHSHKSSQSWITVTNHGHESHRSMVSPPSSFKKKKTMQVSILAKTIALTRTTSTMATRLEPLVSFLYYFVYFFITLTLFLGPLNPLSQ
jgi:hypothetical protein